MADSQKSSEKARPTALKTTNKLMRSQKIIQLSPSDTRPQDIPEDAEMAKGSSAPPRSHTPGHLSTKSQDRRKKATELAMRQRSQSLSQKDSSLTTSKPPSKPPSAHSNSNGAQASKLESSLSPSSASTPGPLSADPRRAVNQALLEHLSPLPHEPSHHLKDSHGSRMYHFLPYQIPKQRQMSSLRLQVECTGQKLLYRDHHTHRYELTRPRL